MNVDTLCELVNLRKKDIIVVTVVPSSIISDKETIAVFVNLPVEKYFDIEPVQPYKSVEVEFRKRTYQVEIIDIYFFAKTILENKIEFFLAWTSERIYENKLYMDEISIIDKIIPYVVDYKVPIKEILLNDGERQALKSIVKSLVLNVKNVEYESDIPEYFTLRSAIEHGESDEDVSIDDLDEILYFTNDPQKIMAQQQNFIEIVKLVKLSNIY